MVSVRPKHKSQLLILVLAMQKVLIQPKFLAKILTPDHDDQQCLRPHVEKKIAKILKIGRVIAIFVRQKFRKFLKIFF